MSYTEKKDVTVNVNIRVQLECEYNISLFLSPPYQAQANGAAIARNLDD
ncbi:hypothetical protein PL84_03645 [Vibrio anguillarum]|nr:hypothetical protein [Vibrio anguillarum]MBT2909675.1 hypothetical protein [Vibrio anguillarum]MBT2942474.1 hypothetical protein [Vibrio anguillarum]MBT2950702.1 hypothetical protein [Vibrio anguillarum]MBT2979233.1 hypothetical protein [Vibrio anguillarum]